MLKNMLRMAASAYNHYYTYISFPVMLKVARFLESINQYEAAKTIHISVSEARLSELTPTEMMLASNGLTLELALRELRMPIPLALRFKREEYTRYLYRVAASINGDKTHYQNQFCEN